MQIISAVCIHCCSHLQPELIASQVLLALLVVAEHFKSITPSTLVITYAFLKGLFSAAIMRSSIQIDESDTTTILFYLVTAAYLFMALVELVGKIGVLVEKVFLFSSPRLLFTRS
jgi:hypothetical protein